MKARSRLHITSVLWVLLFLLAPLISASGEEGKGSLLLRENMVPSLGTGKIKVRLYADYFCGPCRGLEPKAEPVIADLVKRNAVTITFIDAPFHKHSALYTKYFLLLAKDRKETDYVLKVRSVLFEASKQRKDEQGKLKEGINDAGKLEEYLGANGFKVKHFDVTPLFAVLEGYLREDKINETPTCVIIRGDKKEFYKGGTDIMKALTGLK